MCIVFFFYEKHNNIYRSIYKDKLSIGAKKIDLKPKFPPYNNSEMTYFVTYICKMDSTDSTKYMKQKNK